MRQKFLATGLGNIMQSHCKKDMSFGFQQGAAGVTQELPKLARRLRPWPSAILAGMETDARLNWLVIP